MIRMIKQAIGDLIKKAAKIVITTYDASLLKEETKLEWLKTELEEVELVEHPTELSHGDLASNIGLLWTRHWRKNPMELAQDVKDKIDELLKSDNELSNSIQKIKVEKPGFINFYLSQKFFADSIKVILKEKDKFGRNKKLKGQKIMVEYTQPNPFKEFHIGHLMNNTIGEAISRIVEFSGAEVRRANYQGDVGLHVAKAIWGMREQIPEQRDPGSRAVDAGSVYLFSELEGRTLEEKIKFLGDAYALGSKEYEENEKARKQIDELNQKIYDKSDPEVMELYERGKEWSLSYFATIYNKLGTSFDFFFFESESGEFGMKIVKEFLKKGIFEESEGAIIFPGEKYGLHTRVFITSQDLPTYEAKELGLAKTKYEKYPYDISIVVTGNEINDYFKVIMKSMEFVFPDLQKKTRHVSHGMLRLPGGKMSSRTGDIVSALSFIEEIKKRVLEKIEMSDRTFSPKEKDAIAEEVAVGALKFFILKNSPGHDIIFDFEKALSLEGDSGPYLQYSYTRASSVLEKAKNEGIQFGEVRPLQDWETIELEHLLYRFPEVIERALYGYEPQHIVTYLLELAQSFNSFYAKVQIVDDTKDSSYKVALTQAFATVMKNGLHLLGIKTPEKM